MIGEIEMIARIERLESPALRLWIAKGWLRPAMTETGYSFDETDVARAHLLRDLSYEMGFADEDLGVVLSLMDQLHGARRRLRAMAAAICEQPEAVRAGILTRFWALLSSEG